MSNITTHDLAVDGRATSISLTKLSPTSIQLNWVLPTTRLAYNGAVVLLSESPLTPDNFPVDGTKYIASTNWAVPVDGINGAKVVASFYGFFGDNIEQNTVTVSNIDSTKLYYASIHVCSNVLQYFATGSQSYPLEANDPAKMVSPFAGSIQETSFAPENPYNGQVYFDTSSSSVLIWNDEQSAWVKIDQATVPIGELPPVSKAQLFYDRTSREFQFFDGTAFVGVNATNLRVKMGSVWAPYDSFDDSNAVPTSPVVGMFVYYVNPATFAAPSTWSLKFYSLGQWFTPSPDLVEVLIGGNWTKIFPMSNEPLGTIPQLPIVGNFFYKTSTKDLMVWSGEDWVKADTAQPGTPAADKINVGTDGSVAARAELIRTVQGRLGYPAICVELSEDQFQGAVSNALAEFRKRADNAQSLQYVAYTIVKGQSTYYLNDPRDKTNKISSVLKIHRVNMLGVSSLSAENGLYAQAFFNQLYQGSNVDLLSIHLMNQLSESYERIFAGNLMYTWNEASRQLTILRNLSQAKERVILEVAMEREEQELIYDRWSSMWIQDWTYADSLERLGLIRSKYGTLPGANGGITLNGQELLQMAAEKKNELLRQINDFEVGNGGVDFGNCSFLIG